MAQLTTESVFLTEGRPRDLRQPLKMHLQVEDPRLLRSMEVEGPRMGPVEVCFASQLPSAEANIGNAW